MSDSLVTALRFDHLTLISRDLEATRHFYVELLGLREIARPAFSFPGIWLQVGEVSIHVTQESPEAGRAGWGDQGVGMPARGHHFAFEVADCAAAAETLQAAGIPIASPLQTRPDGIRQVYFYDPDNHVVELYGEK